MNSKWDSHASRYLPEADLQSADEPFPRSTMIKDNTLGLLKMYLIDRRFNFISYCFEGYLRSVINQKQAKKLDTSIVNGTCSDLKHVAMSEENQFLITFCLSTTLPQAQSQALSTVLTVVQIREPDSGDASVFYYTVPYEQLRINFDTPVRFVGNFTSIQYNKTLREGNHGLFIANIYDEQDVLRPTFFWINFTMFEQMRSEGDTARFDSDQKLILRSVQLILTNHTASHLIDFKTLFNRDHRSPFDISMALVLESEGLLLCEVTNYRLRLMEEADLVCSDDKNSFFNFDPTAIGLYYEPEQPDKRLFMMSAFPPKVTEYDIRSFRNHYIPKIYIEPEGALKRYVGQAMLAVNRVQVLHLLRDMQTNQYLMRVFNRETSFFKIIQVDIPLPAQSRMPFFAFPNYHFDKILYRDERTTNITQVNSQVLVVNRSEPAMNPFSQESGLNDKVFNVSIYHQGKSHFITSFQILFISASNFSVFPVSQSDSQTLSQAHESVFYSCGDIKFSYQASKLFSGPHFNLQHRHFRIDNQSQEMNHTESPFSFIKSSEKVKFEANMTEIDCEQSIIVPSTKGASFEAELLVMICINMNKAQFTSYRIAVPKVGFIAKNFTPQIVIDIPFSKILDFQFDDTKRVLLALVALTDQDTKEILSDTIEVHYFHVEGCLNWRHKHPIQVPNFQYNASENAFTYSSRFEKGLFIWNAQPYNPEEPLFLNVTFLIFRINFTTYEMCEPKYYSVNSTNGRIRKALITNDNLFIGLAQVNKLIAFQIFPDVIKAVSEHVSIHLSSLISDFDLLSGRYLILYHLDSTTDVYETDNSIDIQHKMRLSLYPKYQFYRYKLYEPSVKLPKRDSFESTLVILMEDPYTNEIAYMVYKVNQPQHNALYIASAEQNELFQETKNSWIILTGDNDEVGKHFFGVITDTKFVLIEFRYYDMVQINRDKNQALIDLCKLAKDPVQFDDNSNITLPVGLLELQPISNLSGASLNETIAGSALNISFQSKNLGLAITPQQQDRDSFNIHYREERQYSASQYLMLESYFDGYNVLYESKCSYLDTEGAIQNCTSAIQHNQTTLEYQFPIDFVTSERWVHQLFPLDRYYLVLDNQDSIYIMSLPDSFDIRQPNQKDGIPLTNSRRLNQTNVLGCQIHDSSQFSSMKKVEQPFYHDRIIYLFFYQCEMGGNGNRSLSAIEIALFQLPECEFETTFVFEKCIAISRFENPDQVIYDIIDLDLVNLTVTLENPIFSTTSSLTYKADLALVCEIVETYTNLLLIYDLTLNGSQSVYGILPSPKTFQEMTLMKYNSASKILWDNFKVNSVDHVQNTKLLFASVDGFGAILYHTGINQILMKINISEFEKSKDMEQAAELYSELKVFDVKVTSNYVITIFSNFGYYAFQYRHSFQEEQIYVKAGPLMRHEFWRVFRLPFKIVQAEVAAAPYAHALLGNHPTGRKTFEVKLIAFTFYASTLSKLFRSIDVEVNQNCSSLSRNPFLEDAPQDQLALTFICDQRLRIVRFCLKPNMEININSLVNKEGIYQGLEFKPYNLTITGQNDYSQVDEENLTFNIIDVPIVVEFSQMPYGRTTMISYGFFALSAVFALVIFFVFKDKGSKSEEGQQRQPMPQAQGSRRQNAYLPKPQAQKKKSEVISKEKRQNTDIQTLDSDSVLGSITEGNVQEGEKISSGQPAMPLSIGFSYEFSGAGLDLQEKKQSLYQGMNRANTIQSVIETENSELPNQRQGV